MLYRLAADLVVLIHLGFILFVVLGGLLVLWRRRWAWIHLPAVVWGTLILLAGWICPLTPLENSLRRANGVAQYSGGFIDHHIVPIIYPPGLTRSCQITLGIGVLAVNLVLYGLVVRRFVRDRARQG